MRFLEPFGRRGALADVVTQGDQAEMIERGFEQVVDGVEGPLGQKSNGDERVLDFPCP